MNITLAEFIAPLDPAEFRARHYGRQPVHLKRRDRKTANPLPWGRFNELLGLTPFWNEDTLKVIYRNREALRENYCRVEGLAAGAPAPADPKKVQALLGFGASLVANQLQRVSPEVGAICHMLQREFAASAGANAYCSFTGVQAFGTHFDLHDVFALQAEGRKTWNVYEGRADNPVAPVPPGEQAERWLASTRGRILFKAEMEPGDLLYLPRGQYHDALTGAEASLHVSFSVKPPTGLALFALLESAAEADGQFRAYLPDAADGAALSEHLARLASRLQELMRSPAFATDVRNHQRGLAVSPADYTLPVQRRPQYFSAAKAGQVVRRPEGYVATFEGIEIALGATGPAFGWLLGQRMFSLEDVLARFPYVAEEELRRVLDEHVKAGAIVETEMR